MKLIKSTHDQSIINSAKQKTYKNVTFSSGYINFLESLVRHELISADYTRKLVNEMIQWDNQLTNNGIIIETTENPLLNVGYYAGDVVVTGNKASIELFDHIMETQSAEYEESKTKKIKIKLEYHDTLNPKLWSDEETLKKSVLSKLKETAQAFFEFLDMPNLKLEDITITGSSANYNWTSSSDIDLHLLVDLKEVEKEYGSIASNYFNAQRKVWADLHDIEINGIPLECYVQDINEKHYSSGVYSIQNEEWVKEPKKEKPELDKQYIKNKASYLMKEIDNLIKVCNNPTQFEKMQDKLTKMRKAGLEDAGEFSDENYVYKTLRDAGYLDKLAKHRTDVIDKELSLKKVIESIDEEKDDPWASLGYHKKTGNVTQTKINNNEKKTRVNLNVPYSHRESAKKMGARWDAGIRKWYMIVPISELDNIPSSWR